MKICVREGQFFADGFAVRRCFEMAEGERRLLSYLSEGGCGCGEARITEGILSVSGDSIGVIEWSGAWEIYPHPLPRGKVRECVRDLTFGEKTHRVHCRCGARSEISVDDLLRWEAILPIYDPEITMLSGQRDPILDVRARCEEGEYLLLAALGENGGRVLLERCGEKITCVENEVTIVKNCDDLRKRRITERCVWRGDSFDCSREIVCTHDHPFIREVMGRLLLEAVSAKDEASIRELLSPEVEDVQAILDYFGEIHALRAPLSPPSPTAYAVLKKKGRYLRGMIYQFDFDESGNISNIHCDE